MNTCNQCHREMLIKLEDNPDVRVCDNPECPNYGLLQVSAEKMADKEEEKNG